MHQTRNRNLLLFSFILLKFILHYSLIGDGYDLHRDEYLHLDQGRHLAWGYLSVAPVTSWFSYIILLLGNGVFWVKFFPALFGALTIVVVWKAIEELNGNYFALITGTTAVLFSAIMRLNILYQPNSFDILAWTAFYFVVVKYINTKKVKWFYIGAVVFAFGFLNKYNFGFLLAGFFPALLITPVRKIFTKKDFYYAVLLGFLLVSPNIFWQYQNGFPVIHHMKELAETQLVNVSRLDFLKEQLLFFIGSVFILLFAFIAFFIYEPFSKYRIIFWSFVFTLILFIYLKAKGYYAIGLYPVMIAFGSVYIEYLLSNKWKYYLRPVVVILPVAIFLPVAKVVFPVKSPEEIQRNIAPFKDLNLLRWEDGKDHVLPQDFADMLGWKELAHKTDSAFNSLADKDHTIIVCDNYGQAGAINYYTKNKSVQAVSFNADYINWFPLDKKISNIILVKEREDDDRMREVEKPLFDSVYVFSEVTDPFARETGTTIFILRHAKVNMNKLLRKEIVERRSE